MQTKLTRQYRTEFTLADGTIGSLTSNSDEQIRANIHALLPGATFKDQTGPNGEKVVMVFHPKVAGGENPCGWVIESVAPNGYNLKTIREARLEQVPA
jgi:hypothetical protein